MAILIEANSVVILADALQKYPGGWDTFEDIVPNQTLCTDGEIVRVGFMEGHDAESFIKMLQGAGLEFLRDGEAIDIAMADQINGIHSICTWLEFGHVNMEGNGQRIAACRLVGSRLKQIFTPPTWKFEGSLSSTYGFVPNDHAAEKGLKYLRHEDNIDVYLNLITGEEVYIGRTGEY